MSEAEINGGYVAQRSTLALQRTGTAATRRRVLSLVGYAVVVALVFDVITGPILAACPDVGSNFWPPWGEFALMCLAVALFAATLQSLIGPIGTLVTVVDGNSITQPLVVLSVYVVVGAALVVVLTYGRPPWWRGAKWRRSPISPQEQGGIAAIPPA